MSEFALFIHGHRKQEAVMTFPPGFFAARFVWAASAEAAPLAAFGKLPPLIRNNYHLEVEEIKPASTWLVITRMFDRGVTFYEQKQDEGEQQERPSKSSPSP